MLRIEVFNAHRKYRIARQKVSVYVKRVLRSAGMGSARVTVVFVDSRYARKINRMYLNHDYVTDVISFPLERGRNLEGEVYVNLDWARQQAEEYGVSFANEVARLVIHGSLHLVGYDDTVVRKARLMKKEEDRQIRFWFS
ncbi:MAG: rRNA maturation RNase YbeY [Bacteroidota bacterium]